MVSRTSAHAHGRHGRRRDGLRSRWLGSLARPSPRRRSREGTFESGAEGWVAYGTDGPIRPRARTLCVDVPAGSAQYGVGVVLNGVAIEQGETYTLAYTASASTTSQIPRLV